MRVTPSLPQRGRHPKGSTPLDPHFRVMFINLLRGYHILGMPWRRGWKHDVLELPRAIFEENVLYLFISRENVTIPYSTVNRYEKFFMRTVMTNVRFKKPQK